MILVASDVVVSTKDQVSQEIKYMCKKCRIVKVWPHPFLTVHETSD